MPRLHNPVDYNLTANPSLPRTNSPWRIYGGLILVAAACAIAWSFLRAPVRVSRPTLEYTGERVIATAMATNETQQVVTLSLRVVLFLEPPSSRASLRTPRIVDQQDVEIRIPSRSTIPVSREFPRSEHSGALQAEVHILSQR